MSQFKHPLQKYGKPTGNLRDKRWLEMRQDKYLPDGTEKPVEERIPWEECSHWCNVVEDKIEKLSGSGKDYKISKPHGKWYHWVSPVTGCHLPWITECPKCIEYPTPFHLLGFKKGAE